MALLEHPSVDLSRPRTLMVCSTIWLIATQATIFDHVKFVERVQLLEQTARSLGAPQVVVPTERPSHSSERRRTAEVAEENEQ